MTARLLRAAAGVGLALALTAVLAGPASAHVTVHSADAQQGGYGVLAFRIPNEQDSASTTQVEIDLPPDQPLASVLVQPKAGWTAKVDMAKLAQPISSDDGPVTQAVTRITWSGGRIDPGQFDEFDVSAGPLPKAPTMEFKALQTSDGTVVRWIEDPGPDGKEPDHPAPKLALATASPDTATTSGPTATTTPAATSASASRSAPTVALANVAKTSQVDRAQTRSTVALAIAIIGVLAAIAALVIRRRPA